MKILLTAFVLAVSLTGCAASTPGPVETETPAYPMPAVANNAIPKSCDLPELTTLLSDIAGTKVSATENPVNSENSTEEDIQNYLAGRYLACIYSETESTEATYVIWDESVAEEWSAVMQDANEGLEPGEGLFETTSLGLGELQAYVLMEGAEGGSLFTGHSFKNNVSVLVYSDSLTDLAQGKDLLSAALKSMP
jgi:hypothetical protein